MTHIQLTFNCLLLLLLSTVLGLMEVNLNLKPSSFYLIDHEGLLSSSDSSSFLSLGGESDPDSEEKNNRGY